MHSQESESLPKIESYTGFQPLREVWVGGVYPQAFYQHLPNEVEDALCRITEMTQSDLAKLHSKIEEFGVRVRRPEFDSDSSHYRDDQDNLIKPPITPRDWACTIGDTLLITPQGYHKEPYESTMRSYRDAGQRVHVLNRGRDPRAWLSFPGVVRVGRDLYVDLHISTDDEHRAWYENSVTAAKLFRNDYRIHIIDGGGHSDGVFCPVKPGVIFSSHWGDINDYKRTFPDWEVFWLRDPTIKRKKEFRTNGWSAHWWLPEVNSYSPIFHEFIQKSAKDWIGNVQETVFEVNMLVIDEKNVICISDDEWALDQLRSVGITPHVVDFQTRSFWDGGIHCLTTDIHRSGGMVDYFPDRPFPYFNTHGNWAEKESISA